MKMSIIVTILACTLAIAAVDRAEPSFTDEASILSVSHEDQTEAVKTGLLKKEVTLPQVIEVLTSYRKVNRDQYLIYAHQSGARGAVTLKGGTSYLWEIEPDYAATVTAHRGETVYLLHPRLKTEPAGGRGQ
ncbi:MAG TPA: hypothetical protein VGR35_20550 [Tepidisphaeraceae bacterium]|nr:hypothetical protein [Tepidisphaeraceae bacterium]